MVAKTALAKIKPQALSNEAPPPPETLWVHFEATIPEPLASVFSTLPPWRWRELRPFFCRYPENRRLRNIGQSIHSLLERGPHMLARGHWSVEEYITARKRLGTMIATLGHFVSDVAADARVFLLTGPDETTAPRARLPQGRRTG
jgi:hypothetical protein